MNLSSPLFKKTLYFLALVSLGNFLYSYFENIKSEKIVFERSPPIKLNNDWQSKLLDLIDSFSKELNFSGAMLVSSKNRREQFFWKWNQPSKKASTAVGDTPYMLASLSKPLLAILVHQAVEKKFFGLNDSFCRIMKISCSITSKKISIQSLLDHQAGLSKNGAHGFLGSLKFLVQKKTVDSIRKTDLDRLANLEILKFKNSFHYSNYGYRLLSYLLEKVHNQEFSKIVEEQLSLKFNLKSTFLHRSERKNEKSKNSLIDFLIQKAIPEFPSFGAGSIVSSTNDLEELTKRILAREIFLQRQVHLEFFDDRANRYKNGFVQIKNEHDQRIYFHNGANTKYFSEWFIFPHEKISVIFLGTFSPKDVFTIDKLTNNIENFFMKGNYQRNM